ncbi:hypothetical protein OH76DRAFT_1490781 [Lentinus brumalis]|uniref:Uncharacterized protein n=1 Tax=Lentinus brumalis TaxID=2498619 RepID=A0A371CHV2_9APHY|nr:hypothetical protein OH76DRAFT_1490781 [Polyporus brumalis]
MQAVIPRLPGRPLSPRRPPTTSPLRSLHVAAAPLSHSYRGWYAVRALPLPVRCPGWQTVFLEAAILGTSSGEPSHRLVRCTHLSADLPRSLHDSPSLSQFVISKSPTQPGARAALLLSPWLAPPCDGRSLPEASGDVPLKLPRTTRMAASYRDTPGLSVERGRRCCKVSYQSSSSLRALMTHRPVLAGSLSS